MVNGLTGIAITKLDVLDCFEKIKVCTGYKYKGEIYKDFSFDNSFLQECKPVYKEFSGWQKDTIYIKNYEDLPVEAKDYLEFISSETGIDICMISVGQQKEQTIIRRKIW
jgi:adenylosuccinate synthase